MAGMRVDREFLREAIRLSIEKMQAGEGGPFGALVVRGGRVVGRGWNQVTSTNDPTAHAEIVAIRAACGALGTFQLSGCTLYASCEPCPMCLAAIYWARIERIVFAAGRQDAADAGFDDSLLYDEVTRSPADRSLPAEQCLREEALAAFLAWRLKGDRVEY